ncbi:MAG: hypothetical protein IJN42_01990, partial [Clostridia bacterium]|nr:hypothetical protein [Clostridia bacterium]
MKIRRIVSLLLTLVMLLGSIPFAAFPASAANQVNYNHYETALTGFNGYMFENFDSGYRFENTGHNNISISSASAKNFTFEADVTLVDGNTATLLLGAGKNDYDAVVARTTQCFGLQFQKLNNNINITLFEWGGSLGGSIIANTKVTTTTMSNFHIKVAHSDANSLEIWVNGVKADYSFAKNFAGAYKGGYIGLMSFKSVIKFENIRCTLEGGTTITNILPDLKYASGKVSVVQGTRMKNNSEGNNYSSSAVRGKYFTLESVINMESGERASVILGASSPTYTNLWKTTHNWFGIEFRKFASDNSIRVKLFNSGGPSAYKVNEIVAQTSVTTTTESYFRIKVSYTLANGLEIWVNDVKANLTFKQDFDDAYGGGHFGFLTYLSGATYSNILLNTAEEIRVTCVGDSITEGYGVSDRGENSYPAQLQKVLGEGYSVKNSGVGGANATQDINKPYINQTRYADGKQRNPDIVIMMLGTNDGNPAYVWDTTNNAGSLESFKKGYQTLIDAYQEAGVGTIFLALPPYSKNTNQQPILETYIIPAIKEMAAAEGLSVIDMNAFTKDQSTWYYDNVHMNEAGNKAIAEKFADVIMDHFDTTRLADFEIKTEGVTITPAFDPDVNIYGMDIQGGIDSVVLKPVKKNADQKIYYTLKNREYKTVTKAKTEVTDTITLTAEDFIENYVNMDLTVVSPGGSERTVTFRINKWFTAEELSEQPYRAQFHITPQINFMNDPNGMVYDPTDGYWHVHYQYSPQNTMGQQSWAHVRSKDLVSWEQMPLSLQVDDLGRIYSGSAISLTEEEAKNPAIYDGIFADNKEGESRLIAFYTNAGVDGLQRQCTAYSKDHGITWTKYEDGAPIIDNDQSISGGKFGDPKVFKIPGDNTHWYMVTIGKAQMFVSSDLIHWEKVQTLKYREEDSYTDATDGIINSECPGMNPVMLEGTDEVKWIYSGSDTFYVVGNMVKNETTGYYNWVAESARIPNESNYALYNVSNQPETYGKYAGMTFYEDGTGKGRTIG